MSQQTTSQNRLERYKSLGKRVSSFLYNECAQIIGQKRWEKMIGSSSNMQPHKLPTRMYKPAAELLFKHSSPKLSTVQAIVKDLKNVIRLRKTQSSYYQHKPNQTPEDPKYYNGHQHFISVLGQVLDYMNQLCVRLAVEASLNEQRNDIPVVPSVDESELEESIETFQESEKSEASRIVECLRRSKEDELEHDYGFYLACFQIDSEGIRSLCMSYWQMYVKGKLSLEIAAMMTNVGYLLLEACMAELVLETENIRKKLSKTKVGVLQDSDPLYRIHQQWRSQMNAGNVQYSETHFGLGLDVMLEYWNKSSQTQGNDLSILLDATPLADLTDIARDSTPGHEEENAQQKRDVSAFLVREFLRTAKVLPPKESPEWRRLPESRGGDRLTVSMCRMFREDSIGDWQPLGLDMLVDAINILGSKVDEPWKSFQQTHRKTHVSRVIAFVRPPPESLSDFQYQFVNPDDDPMVTAIGKLRWAAKRKAKKRGKNVSESPIITQIPEFFLCSKNVVQTGITSYLRKSGTNGFPIIHEMYQIRSALVEAERLPRNAKWNDLDNLAEAEGEEIFFAGLDRPKVLWKGLEPLLEIKQCCVSLQETVAAGELKHHNLGCSAVSCLLVAMTVAEDDPFVGLRQIQNWIMDDKFLAQEYPAALQNAAMEECNDNLSTALEKLQINATQDGESKAPWTKHQEAFHKYALDERKGDTNKHGCLTPAAQLRRLFQVMQDDEQHRFIDLSKLLGDCEELVEKIDRSMLALIPKTDRYHGKQHSSFLSVWNDLYTYPEIVEPVVKEVVNAFQEKMR
ncbi:hypothetical protein HRS9139_09138 [Pyrenophora teres f. teres]|nr:hypothetical protein HRS9139_09138 [Pyrenophora teres f. teres]KAE8855010.1 hypothetical protein PTNB29_09261 [Pyrenophora teres f. teres]CAE7212475.1 hypothetical protein PTTW11_10305 [Pyrenophora teres f. teres]